MRTSLICTTGAIRSETPRSASSADAASARSTRYSDWSSSPALGVNSARKCGSRSCAGPVRPCCSVHAAGSTPGIGWRGPSASGAPNHCVAGNGCVWSATRCLVQNWNTGSAPQAVNMLVLYAVAVSSPKWAAAASKPSPS